MSNILPTKHQPRPASTTRLTVIETVYYQLSNSQPMSVPVRFTRQIKTDEQPWVRKIQVGENWQPIDKGWIKNCSMLMLVNEEGSGLQKVPTEEERRDISARVVLIGNDSFCVRVRPGESCRIEPDDFLDANLICMQGKARCTLYIFPGEDE